MNEVNQPAANRNLIASIAVEQTMTKLIYRGLLLFFLAPCPGGWCQSHNDLIDLYVAQEYDALIAVLDAPESAAEWKLRGDALQKANQPLQALEAYYSCESEGGGDAELYLHRAICHLTLGSVDAARNDLEQARDLGATDKRLAYYSAAIAFGDHAVDLCLYFIAEAVAADPNYFDAHYLAGALFYDVGRLKDAEKAFTTCLKIDPSHERAQLNLAMVMIDQLKYGKARDVLEGLINSDDDDLVAEVYYQRGVARYESRDRVGACEDWANAADLGDDDARNLIETACTGGKKRKLDRKSVYVAF